MALRSGGSGGASPAGSAGQVQYTDGTALAASPLYREDANTIAQRNGTTAQKHYIYNTWTDASNYERLALSWASNTPSIRTEKAGTGVQRSLTLGVDSDLVRLTTGRWGPENNGALDLGGSSNSWLRLYMDYTNTATIGAVTINKAAGRVNIASGATSVVVTNSRCTAAAHVQAWPSQADANNPYVTSVVPGAGTFTVTVNTAPAANQSYDFFIINAD